MKTEKKNDGAGREKRLRGPTVWHGGERCGNDDDEYIFGCREGPKKNMINDLA